MDDQEGWVAVPACSLTGSPRVKGTSTGVPFVQFSHCFFPEVMKRDRVFSLLTSAMIPRVLSIYLEL